MVPTSSTPRPTFLPLVFGPATIALLLAVGCGGDDRSFVGDPDGGGAAGGAGGSTGSGGSGTGGTSATGGGGGASGSGTGGSGTGGSGGSGTGGAGTGGSTGGSTGTGGSSGTAGSAGMGDAGTDAPTTCSGNGDCDDSDVCTVDSCDMGVCEHVLTPTSDPDMPDATATDENCDGVEGNASGDLYVTPTGTGAGTPGDPASLAAALAAFAAGQHIFVAEGDYTVGAPLEAPDGISMHGGYASDFRSRSGQTRVVSSASQALIIDGATSAVVDRVDFETEDATAAGAHTQTVTVVDSTGVALSNLTVVAGAGRAGANGAPGAAGDPPASAGPNGSNGSGSLGGSGASCGTPGGQGQGTNGPKVAGTSAAVTGSGCGNGGTVGATVNDNRTCDTGAHYICSSSGNGRDGEPGCPQNGRGTVGNGGSGSGTVAASGTWSGSAAQAGGDGPTGNAAGGGAGGTNFARSMCDTSLAGGGGGGCGGPGGNGGRGGFPGRPGGASIGVVLRDSTVTLSDVTVRTSSGGTGGRGGDGGAGANGVPGSSGGTGGIVSGLMSTTHQGASGGKGGDGSAGGPGGCGGGGAGGPSFGVFVAGSSTLDVQNVTYQLGASGTGGQACPAASGDPSLGNPGQAGTSLEVFDP